MIYRVFQLQEGGKRTHMHDCKSEQEARRYIETLYSESEQLGEDNEFEYDRISEAKPRKTT